MRYSAPVLFALTLAETFKGLPPGVSHVDDCSWAISFETQQKFKAQARELLDKVHRVLEEHGFQMDEGRTAVA